MKKLRVMHIGDVSGDPGMGALFLGLSSLINEYKVDFVIANGENAAGGFGIGIEEYQRMISLGVDVITSGNHIWQKEEIFSILDRGDNLLRPINYPEGVHGRGWTIKDGIAVINAQGRLAMPVTDCPFKTTSQVVSRLRKTTPLIFVDFHAERSEEKEALAFYLDGKVSAVVGTHTHVQTRDERILPKGTAYITDLGLTGVLDGVIGSREDKAIERMLTQLPIKSEIKEGVGHIQGVVIDVDAETGHALHIERFTK